MREPSRPTHRTPHTSSNLMTIPDLSANADIVVIGFGGTTPVKVRLKLPPAVFSSAFTILGVLLPRWICRACAFRCVWCHRKIMHMSYHHARLCSVGGGVDYIHMWFSIPVALRMLSSSSLSTVMISVPLSLFTPTSLSFIMYDFNNMSANTNIAARRSFICSPISVTTRMSTRASTPN